MWRNREKRGSHGFFGCHLPIVDEKRNRTTCQKNLIFINSRKGKKVYNGRQFNVSTQVIVVNIINSMSHLPRFLYHVLQKIVDCGKCNLGFHNFDYIIVKRCNKIKESSLLADTLWHLESRRT